MLKKYKDIKKNILNFYEVLWQGSVLKIVISALNPLATGVHKKFIHTLTKLHLKAAGFFQYV